MPSWRAATLAALCVLAAALAGCGEQAPPEASDADGDGLYDQEETQGWQVNVTTQAGVRAAQVTSDPANPDTDGDGLVDRYEFILGADARDADTDDDGLTDCQETRHTVKAQCEDPGFAGVADKGTLTLVARWDSDGDRLADGMEVLGFEATAAAGGRHTIRTDALRADSDLDFLADGDEQLRFRTDPTAPDTDGDGCRDGLDPVPASRETFTVRIDQLQLSEGGRIRIKAVLAGNVTQSAAVDVQAGTNDLSQLALPAVRPVGCTTSPLAPWVSVAVLVERVGGPGGLVDTHSQNPNRAVQGYWNHLDGTWSWDSSGSQPHPLPSSSSGTEGALITTPILG